MRWLTLLACAAVLAGCASAPPHNRANLCSIFQEKDDWYVDADNARKRWGAPIPVQMAIINQESGFRDDAKPPHDYLLGFIPWGRISSAYGYTQALDSTWQRYADATGNGGADRDDFDDATDFVGWYLALSHRRLGISMRDARRQYLAYYFGRTGYRRGDYRHRPRIRRVARGVDRQAGAYTRQLAGCRAELEANRGGWWPF